MKSFFAYVRKLLEVLLERFELLKYNEYTIGHYFRKKGYQVGYNNRLYIRGVGSEPYLVKIGNHCTITAGVLLITHDGGAWVFREKVPDLNVMGTIEIKDNCFIGSRSILLPNVVIGPNAVVGAGSVVTRDVPPNSVVAGVPARVICSLEEYQVKCMAAWNAMGLKGPRDTWKEQLIRHFWADKHSQ